MEYRRYSAPYEIDPIGVARIPFRTYLPFHETQGKIARSRLKPKRRRTWFGRGCLTPRRYDLRRFGGNVFGSAFVISRTRGREGGEEGRNRVSRSSQNIALRNRSDRTNHSDEKSPVSGGEGGRTRRRIDSGIYHLERGMRNSSGVAALDAHTAARWQEGGSRGRETARRTFDNGAGSTFRLERRRNFRG